MHKELSQAVQVISLNNVWYIFYNDILSLRTLKENKQHGQISTDFGDIFLRGIPAIAVAVLLSACSTNYQIPQNISILARML